MKLVLQYKHFIFKYNQVLTINVDYRIFSNLIHTLLQFQI